MTFHISNWISFFKPRIEKYLSNYPTRTLASLLKKVHSRRLIIVVCSTAVYVNLFLDITVLIHIKFIYFLPFLVGAWF
jgi:hypothetical protein